MLPQSCCKALSLGHPTHQFSCHCGYAARQPCKVALLCSNTLASGGVRTAHMHIAARYRTFTCIASVQAYNHTSRCLLTQRCSICAGITHGVWSEFWWSRSMCTRHRGHARRAPDIARSCQIFRTAHHAILPLSGSTYTCHQCRPLIEGVLCRAAQPLLSA